MSRTAKQMQDLVRHFQDPKNAHWGRVVTIGTPKAKRLLELGGSFGVEVYTLGTVIKSDDTDYTIKHMISTPRIDYIMDVMNPFGVKAGPLEKNRGVFFNHKWDQPGNDGLPIGRNLWIKPEKDGVVAKTQFAVGVTKNDFAGDIYRLTVAGYLPSWSIGFFPTDFKVMPLREVMLMVGDKFAVPNASEYDPEQEVLYHGSWTIYEYSKVSVPMNQDAIDGERIQAAMQKGLIKSDEGINTFGKLAGGRPKIQLNTEESAGTLIPHYIDLDAINRVEDAKLADNAVAPGRWNCSLSKAFDVAAQEYPASDAEVDLVAKFLGVQVKDIYESAVQTPSVRMGEWLTAKKNVVKPFELLDTRNLLRNGTEAPPVFETIRLNSKLSNDFLVEGLEFYEIRDALVKRSFVEPGPTRFVIKLRPAWWGIETTIYTTRTEHGLNHKLFGEIGADAATHKFLKGEALSLSGEFLGRRGQDWPDVFLEDSIEGPLKRTVKILNERGAQMANRGVILMGPPGTGKTLSGRVVMNQAKSTFIWVAARDFHYAGAFGGITMAFDLARENAPAVIFFEDIDNWITEYTVDLLKTELDGIGQSSGVVTFLTTNFPERLPKALIDRPGRFHDVLRLALPGADVRARMLAKWIPELTDPARASVVERTEGYSGAHLYELANYARVLADETGEELDLTVAKAIDKIDTQREMIDGLQLSGSKYMMKRPVKEGGFLSKPMVAGLGKQGSDDDISMMIRKIYNIVIGLESTLSRLGEKDDELMKGLAIQIEQLHAMVEEVIDDAQDTQDEPTDEPKGKAADKVSTHNQGQPPVGTAGDGKKTIDIQSVINRSVSGVVSRFNELDLK